MYAKSVEFCTFKSYCQETLNREWYFVVGFSHTTRIYLFYGQIKLNLQIMALSIYTTITIVLLIILTWFSKVDVSLNAWADILSDRLIGPHFLPNGLTGNDFLNFFDHHLQNGLELRRTTCQCGGGLMVTTPEDGWLWKSHSLAGPSSSP